ncbi:hypothetical protein BOX15_Mlig010254g1 [Macrostomum lignano]|uniref:Metastasis-associated protein MTA3 n=1 Tax=Macrostomum lignano TaxID=282301 RepID=A0A267GIA1_9PLAT|nr:hypothetical protein BOX15_Mlig010254g1 [Macrostomum lignano]
MAANMYRVGDYVYFETSATAPYQIRRIEELTKTPTGNVEAKVMCFYRRRDVSNTLVSLADKHQSYIDEEEDSNSAPTPESASDKDKPVDGVVATAAGDSNTNSNGSSGNSGLSDSQRHQLKHRELFLSRQVETLPATTIRGKCSVTLLNETESLMSYLNREDAFYYTLMYDSSQKTLLADRGEIRVGGRYQAEVQPLLAQGESDGREDSASLEELVWRPDNGLQSSDIDRYLLVSRAVGTLARAMDASSATRQPGLGLAAASAGRDCTQAHAYKTLHSNGYDLGRAFCALVSDAGPLLCRDELEDWSAGESNLFEEAMEKYGKDFHDIRQDFLPWKSMKAIVEYFYMWKTTDRYVQQKRLKAAEAERKLKQVYIPNYTKPNPAVLYNRQDTAGASRGCESCYTTSPGGQWYAWGPPHLSCRLCTACWAYWKRYGGLKSATRLEKAVASGAVGGGSSASMGGVHRCTVAGCEKEFRLRPQLVRHLAAAHNLDESSIGNLSKAKAVKSMLMSANVTTRLARRLCSDLLKLRRLARRPFDSRFDAKPALKELPNRYSSAGNKSDLLAKQLKPSCAASLTVDQLDSLLTKICPKRDGDSLTNEYSDLLSRDRASVLKPSPRPSAFPTPDLAKRQEFHRQLDEQRAAVAAAAAVAVSSAAPVVSNGGGSALNFLLPQKRSAAAAAATNGSSGQQQQQQLDSSLGVPAAKRPALKAAAAAKYVQQQQQQQQQQSNGSLPLKPSANSDSDSNSAAIAAPNPAASAAEELFVYRTKSTRSHLTGQQLRKAGRRPFKLVPNSAVARSLPNGDGASVPVSAKSGV